MEVAVAALEEQEVVTIHTAEGAVKVFKKDLIYFPDGLFGFPQFTDFAIFDIKDCKPFKSMRSSQPGGPEFVVVEPLQIFKDYDPLNEFVNLDELELGSPLELVVLSIVTLAENPGDITANLRGPLMLNLNTRYARQIALQDERYMTKAPIMQAR